MPKRLKDMDMMKLVELFPDEEACREILEDIRWPEGVRCPRCQGEHIRRDYNRHVYDCGNQAFPRRLSKLPLTQHCTFRNLLHAQGINWTAEIREYPLCLEFLFCCWSARN